MKTLLLVLLALLLSSPGWACPPSGCVEIMAAPEGESWGYRQDLTGADGVYVAAAATNVEVVLDAEEEDSGYRLITVELEATDGAFNEEDTVEYFFVVKEYNAQSPYQLLNTSEEIVVQTSAPAAGCAEFNWHNGCNAHGSPYSVMCWAATCGVEQTCPTPAPNDGEATYCLTSSAGCVGMSFGGGSGTCDCSKPSLIFQTCPTTQTLVQTIHTFWDLCPINRVCVIDFAARGTI